jgi:hypothetical protein
MNTVTATRRTRPVHVGSIPLPFPSCANDYMAVVNGGKNLLVLDASDSVFYVLDALALPAQKDVYMSDSFTVDAPLSPSRFCATDFGTLLIMGDCVSNLWEVCYFPDDTILSGAEIRVLHTNGVPTAVHAQDDTVVVALRSTSRAASIHVLEYESGVVLHAFAVAGLGMEYITALHFTREGYILAVHTGQAVVYCLDGSLVMQLGDDLITSASDGILTPAGNVMVSDCLADRMYIYSGSTGHLLHTVKPRNGANTPFALATFADRVYVMYADGLIHVLE